MQFILFVIVDSQTSQTMVPAEFPTNFSPEEAPMVNPFVRVQSSMYMAYKNSPRVSWVADSGRLRVLHLAHKVLDLTCWVPTKCSVKLAQPEGAPVRR